jgi:hypothetical protein
VGNGSRTAKVGVRVVTHRVCKDCAISISADDSAELHSGTTTVPCLKTAKSLEFHPLGDYTTDTVLDDVVAALSIHTAHVLEACLPACLRGWACSAPNLRGSQLSTRVPISHPARSQPMLPMLPMLLSCNIVSTNGECVTNFRFKDAEAPTNVMEIAQW